MIFELASPLPTADAPSRRSASVRTVVALAGVAATLLYFAWRVGFTEIEGAYAWLFLLAEVASGSLVVAFYLLALPKKKRPRSENPDEAANAIADAPSVDVLITTYNEPLDLLRTTAVAARNLELPHRTFLCDDGNRPEVAALADELGVGYLARSRNTHYKAGNLNHALTQTDGEFVLVLDADHVTRRCFLRRTLPHFADPKLAFVQTPQVYYNLDSFQHGLGSSPDRYWHDSSVFHHVIQAQAAGWNGMFCVGTGCVFRRSALEAIGGFATSSVTEDILTSMRLHARGYRSEYVDEALGFLLAPETTSAYARQRLRWAMGSMQVARKENPLTRGGLTLRQRLAYAYALGTYFTAHLRLFFCAVPLLYVVFGEPPFSCDPRLGAPIVLGKVLLDLFAQRFLTGAHGRPFLLEVFNFLNVPIFARATPALIAPGDRTFRVTPKGPHQDDSGTLIVAVAGLVVVNLTSVAFAVARLGLGELDPVGLIVALAFAGWFAATGTRALFYLLDRQRHRDEPFAIPLDVPAELGTPGDGHPVRIRYLNHEVAYALAPGRVPNANEVHVDLAAVGLQEGVAASITSRDIVVGDEGPGTWLRLELRKLSGPERDSLDRYLFETGIPTLFEGLSGAPAGPAPSPAQSLARVAVASGQSAGGA